MGTADRILPGSITACNFDRSSQNTVLHIFLSAGTVISPRGVMERMEYPTLERYDFRITDVDFFIYDCLVWSSV